MASTRSADLQAQELQLQDRRSAAVADREEELRIIVNTLRSLLSQVFWSAQDAAGDVTAFGSGSEPLVTDDSLQERLDGFLTQYTNGKQSIQELSIEVKLPIALVDDEDEQEEEVEEELKLSLTPVQDEQRAQSTEVAMEVENAVIPSSPEKVVETPVQEPTVQEPTLIAVLPSPEHVEAASGPPPDTTERLDSPTNREPSTQPVLETPTAAPPINVETSPTINPEMLEKQISSSPTIPKQQSGLSSITPQRSNTNQSSHSTSHSSPGLSNLRIAQLRPEYPHQLPSVPQHYVAGRLTIAQPQAASHIKSARKRLGRGPPSSGTGGVWGGSGYTETLGRLVKGQHAGFKHVLGKREEIDGQRIKYEKPRISKTLSTADWRTVHLELKSLRALERIERLKAERLWSFRQIKKQRMPYVSKSHWDHLLDEMTWLQTDFRQERRWKMATAYAVSQAVSDWHEASAEEREQLQISVKTMPSQATQITSSTSYQPMEVESDDFEKANMDIEVEEEKEMCIPPSVKVEAEELVESTPAEDREPSSNKVVSSTSAALLSLPSATATTASSRPASHELVLSNRLKQARRPLLSWEANESIVDLQDLDWIVPASETPTSTLDDVTLSMLFQDIPLYGDLDWGPDRRFDESSPFYSRLSNVSQRFETKPLLVSTLMPAKNLSLKRTWRDLSHLAVDDSRELLGSSQGPSPLPSTAANPAPSTLFNGRKAKEAPLLAASLNPPAEDEAPNKHHVAWAASDDAELDAIVRDCAYNWHVAADIFNSVTKRRSGGGVTAWQCYDRWTKTSGADREGLTAEVPPSAGGGPSATKRQSQAAAKQPQQVHLKTVAATDNPKVLARGVALQEITRRVRRKRDSEERKKVESLTTPRQVNLNAHDTHAQPYRPPMTPMQMSQMKADRDRQQIAAAEMARRQMQMQHEQVQRHQHARLAAAAAGVVPPPPPGSGSGTPISGGGGGSSSSATTASLAQQQRAVAAALGTPQNRGATAASGGPNGARLAGNNNGTPPSAGGASPSVPPMIPQVPSLGTSFAQVARTNHTATNVRTPPPPPAGPGQMPANGSARVGGLQQVVALAQQLGLVGAGGGGGGAGGAGGGHPGNASAAATTSAIANLGPEQIAQLRALLAARNQPPAPVR